MFTSMPLAIGWQEVTGWLLWGYILLVGYTIYSILTIKKNSTSAVAWVMTIIIPVVGPFLYWLFGYQSVYRPLVRKKRHAELFRRRQKQLAALISEDPSVVKVAAELAHLGSKLGASTLTPGNNVALYHEGRDAFDAMRQAIREAKQHIHLEFFIFRSDALGDEFIELLTERARAGVKVRFLFDAVGSWSLRRRTVQPLVDAGGRVVPFLSLSLMRRRLQINLRNHRKILVVDGRVAFTGGLNIGDEYLGLHPFFGPWRDTFMRLQGPAVRYFQRVFVEDWSFAAEEDLDESELVAGGPGNGTVSAQVAWSGPDQEAKSIREIYFAAIVKAAQRVWIATPYFVPDTSLLDALCLAARSGRDVRLICPFRPDKWLPFLAARYYWQEALAAGVKIYQYTAGFIHSKVLIIDEAWSSVGSANFDNRSLYLNFEITCLMQSKEVAAELEAAFLRDLEVSIRVVPAEFEKRTFVSRLAENACRLLSPVL